MGDPRTSCGGVPSVDRRRCEERHLRLRAAGDQDGQDAPSKRKRGRLNQVGNAIHRAKILRETRRERELEPQLMLSAQRSQTCQGGAITGITATVDRGFDLQNCKALLALLGLKSHSLGG